MPLAYPLKLGLMSGACQSLKARKLFLVPYSELLVIMWLFQRCVWFMLLYTVSCIVGVWCLGAFKWSCVVRGFLQFHVYLCG